MDDIIRRMRGDDGVEVKDRPWLGVETHKECFIGEELVDWIIDNKIVGDRMAATDLCDAIRQKRMIEHVTRPSRSFRDDRIFYRFCDPSSSPKIFKEKAATPLFEDYLSQSPSSYSDSPYTTTTTTTISLARLHRDSSDDPLQRFIRVLITQTGDDTEIQYTIRAHNHATVKTVTNSIRSKLQNTWPKEMVEMLKKSKLLTESGKEVPRKEPIFDYLSDIDELPDDVIQLRLVLPGVKDMREEKKEKTVPTVEDFHIIKVIGKGGFGKVLLAKEKKSGKIYAIKQISKAMLKERDQSQGIKVERKVLEAVKKVKHPYIVDMHYAFQTKEKLYFVLTYCPGGELFFHLTRFGKFEEEKACFYSAQILLALGCLHSKNIIYRDLKPENVLLDQEGHVCLADFGTSKLDIRDNTSAFSLAGTPEYLAPEVIQMVGHGKAADWWAYGCFVFEMLTGLPPFHSESSRKKLFNNICESSIDMPRYVSKHAKSLLAGLLCRDIKERLGSKRDAEDIKPHLFFRNIDWQKMEKRELPAPWKPKCQNEFDTSNFDEEFTEWPVESPDYYEQRNDSSLSLFENFSYVESMRGSMGQMIPMKKNSTSKTPQTNIRTLKDLASYPSSCGSVALGTSHE